MRIMILGLVGLAVIGCGSGGGPAPGGPAGPIGIQGPSTEAGAPVQLDVTEEDNTVSGVLPFGPDSVWAELPLLYRDIGLGPEQWAVHDPAERRIAVEGQRVPRVAGHRLSRILNCGQGLGIPRADAGDVHVFLTTWLEAHEDGTLVRTRFEGREGRSGFACRSNGRLEQELLGRLAERLGGGGPGRP